MIDQCRRSCIDGGSVRHLYVETMAIIPKMSAREDVYILSHYFTNDSRWLCLVFMVRRVRYVLLQDPFFSVCGDATRVDAVVTVPREVPYDAYVCFFYVRMLRL